MTSEKPTICAIVAVGPDNVIGRDGVMPWHCAADLRHFRNMTVNNPCVFGRVTFENLPAKPLPNRFNLVCSSSYKNEYKEDVFYADSIVNAIGACSDYERIFICGGAGVYKYVLSNDLVDEMYLTIIKNAGLESKIKTEPDRYTRFPVDVATFFDASKWKTMPVIYRRGFLPKNTDGTSALFFKSVRIR